MNHLSPPLRAPGNVLLYRGVTALRARGLVLCYYPILAIVDITMSSSHNARKSTKRTRHFYVILLGLEHT